MSPVTFFPHTKIKSIFNEKYDNHISISLLYEKFHRIHVNIFFRAQRRRRAAGKWRFCPRSSIVVPGRIFHDIYSASLNRKSPCIHENLTIPSITCACLREGIVVRAKRSESKARERGHTACLKHAHSTPSSSSSASGRQKVNAHVTHGGKEAARGRGWW